MDVRMRNADAVAAKIRALVAGGAPTLKVIADFDFTLSKFWWDVAAKERACSCYKVIEDSGALHASYHDEAQALQRHYYPIEVCPDISKEEKVAAMLEWVTKANQLLAASDLRRETVPAMVEGAKLKLRDHVPTMFDLLREEGIPVLIFSGGVANILESVFERDGINLHDAAHIVSNRMVFDDAGAISGWTEPKFHAFNKFAATIAHEPFMKDNEHRRHILLFGDSIGDVHMADGLEADVLLTVGFLNDKVDERLATYMDTYDVVLLGDPCMSYHVDLLRQIFGRAA
eukprot:TRINITY_DN32615_c0_g1_i1.p1 TRINITY_DN32615_c0_g1~~TRINITY_DN32615_c0_g1_i1.p1  ORF type:complete len:287 (+),score=99.78 TRINITY_DN32615_c0_g1_i1:61-921(+)